MENTGSGVVDRAIVVVTVCEIDDRVVTETSILVVGLLFGGLLTGQEVGHSTETVTASAVRVTEGVEWKNTIVQAHADELVSCVVGVVAILTWVVLSAMVCDRCWVGTGASNDLSNQTTSKGSQMRENEVTAWVWRSLVEVCCFAEVVKRHGSHDGNDDIVVSKVCVEWTAEREVGGIICQRAVDGAVGDSDVLIRQASNEFLEIANTLSPSGGLTVTVIVVVQNVKSLLKAVPLLLSEQGAEIGLTDVTSLVGTDRLHGIGVIVIQSEARWAISLETLGGVDKVLGQVQLEVEITKLILRIHVVVVARLVSSKSVVLAECLRDDNNVELRTIGEFCELGIGNSLEARTKESEGPIDLTVGHAGLTGGSENRFRSGSAVACGRVIGKLTSGGVVESPSVSVPESDTSIKLGTGTNAGEKTLTVHNVPKD